MGRYSTPNFISTCPNRLPKKTHRILHRTGGHEEIQSHSRFGLWHPSVPRNQTEEERQVRALSESTSKAWCAHIVPHYILKTAMADYQISEFQVLDYELQTFSTSPERPYITFTGFRYSDGANVVGTITEKR